MALVFPCIHSGSEITIYNVSSGNKLDGIAKYIYDSISLFIQAYLIKNVLMSFDGDTENIFLCIVMLLETVSTYICNGYPKLKSVFKFCSHRRTMFWVIPQEQNYKMMLQLNLDFKDMFKNNSKDTRITVLTKTKSIVANFYRWVQAFKTKSTKSKAKFF